MMHHESNDEARMKEAIHLLIEELRALRRDCGADGRLPRDVVTKQDLLEMEKRIMARITETLDQILVRVTENTTLVDGVATLVRGLRDQVLNGLDLSPTQQAKADEIFRKAEEERVKLAAALDANVP